MMNMKLKHIFLGLFVCIGAHAGTPALNLFTPYNILMLQPLVVLPELQVMVAYERMFNACGMQADDEETCQDWRKCVNPLQQYHDEQDAIAAFKGTDITRSAGQDTFLFSLDDDNGTHGYYRPCGKLDIDNILLAARYAWSNGITFGLYLPVMHARLHNVTWTQKKIDTSFESQENFDLIALCEQASGMKLYGWERHGLGDLAALFTWDRFYPQGKPWLRNVHGGLRGGLLFPTGLKYNPDLLYGFAFGNGGSLGIVGGATLELWWGRFLRFMMDGEFTQIFGACQARRIKTDPAQTDLLFLVKVPTEQEIGFMQRYTLSLEATQFWRGLSFRAAYQYTRHNDDKLFLVTDHYDPILANTAEYLQEWTTHNLVLSAKYDWWMNRVDPRYYPSLTLLYKHGFNGKRAVLGDSLTVQFSVNF